ncbi:MAG: sulfur oxidation c-type cytochrome SoxX [Acetobacteraceae bacterium]|nr:sulfur oxidation c-type cytochrome SoxX [Acetobacteraceae bacterium]
MSPRRTWWGRGAMVACLATAMAIAAGVPSHGQTAAPAVPPPAAPQPAAPAVPAAAGQALAFDRSKGNCLACHTMRGSDVPSNVGPELSDMKQRFPDRKALYDVIWDEETRNPQTVMPAFGKNLILDQHEINEIIDFLYTL